MKTVLLEIPTMTRLHKQLEVTRSIKALGVFSIATEKGKAAVTCADDLLKAEIIKAVEEAGYIVRY